MSRVQDFYEGRYAGEWKASSLDSSRFTKMWYKAFLEYVLPNVSIKHNTRVLEVGAGYGYIAAFLTELGADYTATDIASTALAQIPKHERCHTVQASGEHLPFADDSFELVLCMEVLEHVESPQQTVDEVFRVARPGAVIVFSCPSYFNCYLPLKLLADLGVASCRRYMVWQIVDRNLMPGAIKRLIGYRGRIALQRAVRLAPPLFEKLEGRLTIVNDAIFSVERRLGHVFPLNRLGLHTMVVAHKTR